MKLSVREASIDVPGSDGPTLVLVTSGSVTLVSDQASLRLGAGSAAYILPSTNVQASGHGDLWASQVRRGSAS